ncbi:hypothetical protein B0H10DRAFT_2445108 [Mycena sp. CBHHK59/15]|nr:hypothetical protein B0H10DRAFT_2445108 [Mycena sp. CBHHK59/15]
MNSGPRPQVKSSASTATPRRTSAQPQVTLMLAISRNALLIASRISVKRRRWKSESGARAGRGDLEVKGSRSWYASWYHMQTTNLSDSLSVVPEVPENLTYMMLSRNVNRDAKYAKPLKQAKYVFMINKPVNDPTLAPDFPVSIAAVQKYQSSISKTGNNKWLVVKDGSEDAFHFAFPVFKPKDPDAEQTTNIETWPVRTEARDELASITNSHSICAFNVFDTDHSLIDAVDIPNKLKGAIVECSFGVIHYSIGGDDSFVGEIMQVLILRPKRVQPLSPFKSAPSKPYRPGVMSPAQVHAQEQQAVNHFTPPVSTAGPSNLPVPLRIEKRKGSKEPEGSAPKRSNKDSNEQDDAASKNGESGSVPSSPCTLPVQVYYPV